MSSEFEVHCFANLTIEELEECKEAFLSMCDSEILSKTIAKEFDELSIKDFADKYPNNSFIWKNDSVANRMHCFLSAWEDPDPVYDKDGNYNFRKLILDFHKDKEEK
jgi:hypothetical protein